MEMGEPRARINYRALRKYLDNEVKKLGSKRKVAEAIGLSHTTIQQLYSGKSSNGKKKTHVNLDTAWQIEAALNVPTGILFLPEVLTARPSTAQAA